MRDGVIFFLLKFSKTLFELFPIFELSLDKFSIRTNNIFNLLLQLASLHVICMFLLLLTLSYIEQPQKISLQWLNLYDKVQVCIVDLQFLYLVDYSSIFQLFLSIETLHYEQKLILVLSVQKFNIYRQFVPRILFLSQRNILIQIHQKFQSLALKFLTKNYAYLSWIFGKSIEEGFAKTIIEAILRIRVAMCHMYKIVSNSQDTLFTDFPMV